MMLVALCALLVTQPIEADPRADAALQRFADGWARVKTLSYRMAKRERMRDGRVIDEVVRVKLRKPDAVYVAALEPRVGQEVIYVAGREGGKLVAHPGKFPDLTVRLSIHGSMATKNQHHDVTHIGFEYTLRTVQQAVRVARAEPNGERLEYGGQVTVDGRAAEVVILHGGARPSSKAVARDDEPLHAFAKRVGADAYRILVENASIDELSDELEAGGYVVPAYYGTKTELRLDLETGLPLLQTTWDAQGNVYERYAFSEMVINPALSDADFDPKNPAYGF